MLIKCTIVSKVLILALLLLAKTVLAADYFEVKEDLNVRTGAGKSFPVAFILKKGDVVQSISKHGNWYEINYKGKTGYVYARYLQPWSGEDKIKKDKFDFSLLISAGFILVTIWIIDRLAFSLRRKRRRDYYRNEYLQSEEWKRKRILVLKRDNWRCVFCGSQATEVHHKRYARNIGREPITWLVSVCHSCHEAQHESFFQKLSLSRNVRK